MTLNITDTPTPPAMTPEQRAATVYTLRYGNLYDIDPDNLADQLEADGVIAAERDALQASLTATLQRRAEALAVSLGVALKLTDILARGIILVDEPSTELPAVLAWREELEVAKAELASTAEATKPYIEIIKKYSGQS